ncbi:MAG: hypothetical protein KDA98_06260 [Acidimicrobiales bacterium]|nr:hypothetical protein [Acidimicrobiales bacterium]
MRWARRTRLAAAAALSLAIPLGCSGGDAAPTTTTTTIPPTGEPVPAEELGIVVDPSGRPYDMTSDQWSPDDEIEVRPVTTLELEDETVRTLAGEALGLEGDEPDPTVRFTGADEVEVSAIVRIPSGDEATTRPVGIRLDVPGTEVARWGPFRPAYGTDGGMGAVASDAGYGRLDRIEGEEAIGRLVDGEPTVALDVDGGGDDVVLFDNGYGDGGFPMAEGVDAEGETVALVIWSLIHPWRLGIPDGEPPPDVTRAEDQLAECLAGARGLVRRTLVHGDGQETVSRCALDEPDDEVQN